MTKDELAAIQRGEPVITEQEQLADREPTEYADLNMADDFDRAVWQIREDYADAAEIESELRLAKLWAERVEVDYDEGPSAIGFHKDGSTYWYLIGDACWDADDPRSEMLAYVCKHWKCASDERDAVEATLATVRSDAHLAREAMAALTEDVAKQRAVIERLERERDEAHRQCHAWAESDKALRAKLEEERAAVGDGIICSVAAWNDVVGRRDQAIADASRLRAENEQLKRDRADAMTDLVTRDRMIERLQKERDEKLWSCPDCAFTFAAYHTNADGKLTCPNCENEAMREVYNEALLWRRELIGERTSYDLRLEAAINTALASKNGAGE